MDYVTRWKTRFTKEPETIAWIKSLEPGVFWDVGANVGVYSWWAKKCGHVVTAFEPSRENVKVLRGLGVTVRDFALGNKRGVGRFVHRSCGESGVVGVGEDLVRVERGRDWGRCSYLKVDVDGGEVGVIEGMEMSGVREVLVEVNDLEVFRVMRDLGFVESIWWQGFKNRQCDNVIWRKRWI